MLNVASKTTSSHGSLRLEKNLECHDVLGLFGREPSSSGISLSEVSNDPSFSIAHISSLRAFVRCDSLR